MFALRLIGRRTSNSSAAVIASVLAIAAAVSEELLFRGLVTTHWTYDFGEFSFLFSCVSVVLSNENCVGPLLAGIFSSILFGLSHSPFFGFNSAVEACLGGVFAYSYW